MTTRAELLSTIEALHQLRAEDKALIAQLQARLDCRAGQCAYCDAVFQIGDPAALDHWRECQKHPARLELGEMRRSYKALETQLDHASDKVIEQAEVIKALRAQLSRRVTL